MTTKTLKLGERSWEIPQLPFIVTIEIEQITKAATDKTSHGLMVCLAGINQVDASITFQSLTEIYIPLDEVIAGSKLVQTQCGLERAKEGEA